MKTKTKTYIRDGFILLAIFIVVFALSQGAIAAAAVLGPILL
jgi:hypothetical protein